MIEPEHKFHLSKWKGPSPDLPSLLLNKTKFQLKPIETLEDFNRLRKVRRLGSGSFASAYLVIDTLTLYPLVLKKSDKDDTSIENEYNIRKYLKIDFSPTIYATIRSNSQPFSLQDMVIGETLTEFLGSKYTKEIACQLLLNTRILFEQSVSHVDLSLDNLIWGDKLYIIDYGNACLDCDAERIYYDLTGIIRTLRRLTVGLKTFPGYEKEIHSIWFTNPSKKKMKKIWLYYHKLLVDFFV